ncbi:uncharacterized protein [Macrobrachium rosenbergii]|uniref:uncharacterized protein isoform X3 n=1 Tax=Macrobrachium rosenbergii TaxID=79674 RepID=UPI0034D5AF45
MCYIKLNVFLAAVALSSLCKAQMISQQEQITVLLTNLNGKLEGLQQALESIEHTQKYIEQSIQNQQSQLSSIEESQLAMGKEVQGLQDFISSQKSPLCKDDFSDFKSLLTKDDCMDGTHNCSRYAECKDTMLSFACSCLPGYSGDGFECSDINECTDADICGDRTSCKNVEGSYKCECSNGYEMKNGRCQGMECLPQSLYIRGLGCITPMLTRLPWEEAKRVCEGSGGRLLENIENLHFEAISQHFKPLMSNRPFPWIGFKNKAWVSTGRAVSKEVVARQEDDLEGDCGNIDLRETLLGLWDASCFDEEYALCQKV